MIKRNIAIAILVTVLAAALIAMVVFVISGWKKDNTTMINTTGKPTIKISEVINEAIYMGAYTANLEIFADEPFSSSDILRYALTTNTNETDILLEDINIDGEDLNNCSVFFDDGRTMRTINQPGTTNVMVIASVEKSGKDVYYAYNIEIPVSPSRNAAEGTAAPEETVSAHIISNAHTAVSGSVTTHNIGALWGNGNNYYGNDYAYVTTTQKSYYYSWTKPAVSGTKTSGLNAGTGTGAHAMTGTGAHAITGTGISPVVDPLVSDNEPAVTQVPVPDEPQITAVPDPVPVEPDPVPVEPDPVPVEPDPVPVEPDPVPAEPDPVPVEPDPAPAE